MRIRIVNGPNLNMLGRRDPKLYGNRSFEDYFKELDRSFPGQKLSWFQSNSEGRIIDELQELDGKVDALVINPAAYSHTSLAIADCLEILLLPKVEVHISRISQREAIRQVSLTRTRCDHFIEGKGLAGYEEAIEWLLKRKDVLNT